MRVDEVTAKVFERMKETIDIVIIPIGSVEAHGNHLPLGTDIFSPRMICEGLDARLGDKLWIAPEIPYGQSDSLAIYPGTVTVPSEVVAEYVFHIGKSFCSQGVRKIILLNGHGGNITALRLAAEKLARVDAAVTIVNWWLDFQQDILKITDSRGHAGEDESSVMLAYNKNLVDMNELKSNLYQGKYRVYFKESGKVDLKYAITGDPEKATVEKGERIIDVMVERMTEVVAYMKQEKYLGE